MRLLRCPWCGLCLANAGGGLIAFIETGNVLDKVTEESGTLAEVALGAAYSRPTNVGGGLIALVKTSS